MSNRLGGKQGTAYLGTNANQPPNWTFNDRDPNQYDTQNVSLGDLWLNEINETVWVLVSLAGDSNSRGSLATWTKLDNGSGSGVLDTLSGDSGGAISPDGASNINITSSITGLTFVGNPGSHSLVLTSTGGVDDFLQTVTANSGGPVSGNLGNINIIGDGTSINIVGNPGTNTLTASLVGSIGDAVQQINTDTGHADPIAGLISLIADQAALGCGTTVSFSSAGNVITLNVTDANGNTIVGNNSGNGAVLTGADNTVFGDSSLGNLTTGNRNTIVGSASGASYASNESDNILIGAVVTGTVGDQHTLKIGAGTGTSSGQLNKAFISGIRGITPGAGDGIPVFIDSNGQLGTVGGGGGLVVETLTGNDLIPISPVSGNINIKGDGTSITITGAGNTLTASVIGGATGILTVEGDTGGPISPLAGAVDIFADQAALGCGSTVAFVGTPHTLTFAVTDANNNTIIGADSGKLTETGTNNTVVGQGSAIAFTTATNNIIVGSGSGTAMTTGLSNNIIGTGSGTGITTGAFNTIIGRSSLTGLTTGSTNIIIGSVTGNNYTTTEANNILIGNSVTGVALEANVLRIGSATGTSAGQLNKSIIAGIRGITPAGGDGIPVYIDSNGQLGTVGTGIIAMASGNTGLPVPADGLHNLNIKGDGVGVTVTGSPGTNTLTISLVGGGGAGIEEVDGDSGTTVIPTGGVINIIADQVALGCGSSVSFIGSGSNLELAVTDGSNNTIIGADSGKIGATGANNTILGQGSFASPTTAFSNTIIGTTSGQLLTTGASNTIVGSTSGVRLTAGSTNTVIGRSNLSSVTTGNNNIVLGAGSANSYTSSESGNIIIGNAIPGVALESNVLRMGLSTGTGAGQINKTFIQGIRGVSPGAGDGIPVFVDSNGQLGTTGSGPVETGPSFSVYLTNNITYFPANSGRTIIYDTIEFDLDGNYDASNGHFTAPTTGLYNFTCNMTVKCGTASSTQPQMKSYIGASNGLRLFALNNSTNLAYNSVTDTPYNGYWSVSGSIYAAMDAGDIALIQSFITANNLTGSNVTYPGTSTFGAIGAPIIPNAFGGSLVSS